MYRGNRADDCSIGKKGVENGGIHGQLIRPLFSDMAEIHRIPGVHWGPESATDSFSARPPDILSRC